MQPQRNRTIYNGVTLLELVIGMSLLAIISVVSIQFIVTSGKAINTNQNSSFAIQKATSLISELRAYAEANESVGGASVLDIFDDGVGTSPLLTIDSTVTDPAHILSGNKWDSGRWKFARRITVRKFPSYQATNVRIVTVKIFLTDAARNDAYIFADLSAVITTQIDSSPTRQVLDIYLLCIENIPGWWVYLAYLKPFIETSLADMESRNPGMEFRRHWITKAGYGRDPEYKPYFNNTVDSTQPINYAYFYPGTMPSGSAVTQYYVPANVQARVNIDGVTTNDYDATNNPYPYTLADQYNHVMRYPQESALYQNRLAAGEETAGNLTYRLLLDDLVLNPTKYRNAIFINLHGELLPMPALRNYSDAAKDPETYPQWRAVTHPEKLRANLADDVKLRVYTYLADPTIAGNNYMSIPVSVVFPNMNLTVMGSDITIACIKGGTDQEAPAGPDPYSLVSPAPNFPSGTAMYATVTYDGINNQTIVRLYYSPLRTPETTDNRGLDTTRRLCGMDYIPCPVEAAKDFSQNLTNATADRPKNTARWIITVAKTALDRELGAADSVISVQTRINDDLTTGTMWPVKNKPANLSTTYIWRTDSIKNVPFSEQYQFQGDPRHCPYADVFTYNGYNWYFDNLRDSSYNVIAEWPSISSTLIGGGSNSIDGWHGSGGTGGDQMEIDVPRFFLFIRNALTGANCVYTSITGWSYYYLGLGNEIGYDSANGFPNSIPVSKKPFDGGAGSRNEQSITTDQTGGVKYIRENVTPYWWGLPWLGENYPDGVYATQWTVNGNLNSGSGANTFVRIRRQDIRTSGSPQAKAGTLSRGTTFYSLPCVRRTKAYGCTSFFNIGTTISTFRHQGRNNTTGTITTSGQEIANNYNFPLPANPPISRPFRLNNNWGNVPTEFSIAEYSGIRCSAVVGSRFYNHQDGANWEGSSLVRLANPSGSNAFIIVNGIDRTVESGSAFIGRYSVLSLVHSFLSCGLPATPSRIVQLPRLEIQQPNAATELNNPVTIPITWSIEWKRWDKQKYTTAYSDDFAELETDLRYTLLYSRDNGKTWLHINGDAPATPGIPDQSLWQTDLNFGGNETWNWDVSNVGWFVEGSYIIMIEAYRVNQQQHYAYHQQKIFINR